MKQKIKRILSAIAWGLIALICPQAAIKKLGESDIKDGRATRELKPDIVELNKLLLIVELKKCIQLIEETEKCSS